jgi:hypothetical protein
MNSVYLLRVDCVMTLLLLLLLHSRRALFWIFRVHDETTTISRAPSWIDIRKQPNRWSFALCSS